MMKHHDLSPQGEGGERGRGASEDYNKKTLILYVTGGRGLFFIHFTPMGLKHFVCNGGVFVTYRNMNTF